MVGLLCLCCQQFFFDNFVFFVPTLSLCHFVLLDTGGGGGCTSVAFVLRMISVVMDNPARSWPYDMIHQFVSRGKVAITRTYRSVIYSYLSTSCCSLGVAETAFVLHTGLLLYLSEQLPFGGTLLMCGAGGFLLLFVLTCLDSPFFVCFRDDMFGITLFRHLWRQVCGNLPSRDTQ